MNLCPSVQSPSAFLSSKCDSMSKNTFESSSLASSTLSGDMMSYIGSTSPYLNAAASTLTFFFLKKSHSDWCSYLSAEQDSEHTGHPHPESSKMVSRSPW